MDSKSSIFERMANMWFFHIFSMNLIFEFNSQWGGTGWEWVRRHHTLVQMSSLPDSKLYVSQVFSLPLLIPLSPLIVFGVEIWNPKAPQAHPVALIKISRLVFVNSSNSFIIQRITRRKLPSLQMSLVAMELPRGNHFKMRMINHMNSVSLRNPQGRKNREISAQTLPGSLWGRQVHWTANQGSSILTGQKDITLQNTQMQKKYSDSIRQQYPERMSLRVSGRDW